MKLRLNDFTFESEKEWEQYKESRIGLMYWTNNEKESPKRYIGSMMFRTSKELIQLTVYQYDNHITLYEIATLTEEYLIYGQLEKLQVLDTPPKKYLSKFNRIVNKM